MSCFCPSGYTAAPDNSECIREITASTSGSASTLVVLKAGQFSTNGYMGTIFYEDITNLTFPIILTGITTGSQTKNGTPLFNTSFFIDSDTTKSLKDRTLNYILGGPGAGQTIVSPSGLLESCSLSATTHGPRIWPCANSNTVWGNKSTTFLPNSPGRLNYSGVWPTTTSPFSPANEWIGFTACFNNPTSQTYYLGMGADDFYRFKLNGVLLVEANTSGFTFGNQYNSFSAYRTHGQTFSTWSVFPITLPAGPNYIQMEGLNSSTGATGGFGAEIYSGSVSSLSAITSQSALTLVTVFTTRDLTGTTFDNSGVTGLTCSSGFTLVTCSGSPFCSQVLRTPCTGVTPTTSTTTTTTRSYINSGYIPVNDCNVLTIQPLNVICNVTNITGNPDSSNGSITLSIVGGVPPYTIEWTFPNGATLTGGKTINGLSTGSYTAVVSDYYGDYTFTTTCTVPGFTTTTTSTTTLPPVPNYLENIFCMSITTTKRTGGTPTPTTTQITFQYNTYINGQTSWISNSGNEIVYFNPSVGTSGVWSLSASTSSIINTALGTSTWTIFKGYPSSPTSGAWTMSVNPPSPQQQTITSIGACSDFLSLTINAWWALDDSDIPTTFKFSGACGGSNETPWFKWYLLGGLTSSDISSFEIYCEDLDNPGYIHWDVTNIPNTTTQVSSSIPWPGGVTINPTTGDPGASNTQGWEGPCPPIGNTHTYLVTLTANLVAGGTKTSTYTFTSTS
jgi:phosphatidylethanolamine-binding protein (PEBP) family uncharacterized protein